MNTDLISVIIPSYKPDNYIYKCLESVARQDIDKQRYEVIIVLNGCNEPYHTDIKLFLQQKFQGIKTLLLQTDIAGVSNARNIGLDNAQGEYIAFIDDDDIVSENYLSELYQTSCYHPLQIVACNVKAFYDNSLNDTKPDYIGKSFLKRKNEKKSCLSVLQGRKFMSSACCKIIPKVILTDIWFDIELTQGEDSLFMATISNKTSGIFLTSEECIYYRRIRQNSSSHTAMNWMKRVHIAGSLLKRYVRLLSTGKYNLCFIVTRMLGTVREYIFYC